MSTGLSLRRALVGMAAVLGLLALTVPPAAAEDTTTTFTLAAGALFVTVPATTDLGVIAGSADLLGGTTATSEDFGAVTVTDERGDLIATWTAVATGTDFVHVDAGTEPDPAQVVAASAVTYDPGAFIITGDADLVTGAAGTLDLGATVEFIGTGTNEVTWGPSLTFELSENQVSGSYGGTVTHNVS